MISPEGIRKKSERKYAGYLRAVAQGQAFRKMVIRGDKTYSKSSLPEFEKEIQSIYRASKANKGYGYTIAYQRVRTKTLGIQDLPTSIYFETETDYLRFLGKEEEVDHFREDVALILAAFPELEPWIIQNSLKVVRYHNRWADLMKVCRFFRDNPRPRMYIRELPVPVHTKFIEWHKGILSELLDILNPEYGETQSREFEKRYHLKYSEPQIRFKILDEHIPGKYFSDVDDLAIPLSQFAALDLPVKRVLVVENKTTLYTTLTLPDMAGTIAIFGSGYGVSNLREVEWLLHVEMLYWGDIDVQGFEILSQLRQYFPHTQSVLMDSDTFDEFFEKDAGVPSSVGVSLSLTGPEQELYDLLKANNWRLEQEKIPVSYVKEVFSRL